MQRIRKTHSRRQTRTHRWNENAYYSFASVTTSFLFLSHLLVRIRIYLFELCIHQFAFCSPTGSKLLVVPLLGQRSVIIIFTAAKTSDDHSRNFYCKRSNQFIFFFFCSSSYDLIKFGPTTRFSPFFFFFVWPNQIFILISRFNSVYYSRTNKFIQLNHTSHQQMKLHQKFDFSMWNVNYKTISIEPNGFTLLAFERFIYISRYVRIICINKI